MPESCLKAGAANAKRATYDPVAEALAQHWLERLTGNVFERAFAEELRDGLLLCRAANELGGSLKPYEGAVAFRQMDNLSKFIKFCRDYGVPPVSSVAGAPRPRGAGGGTPELPRPPSPVRRRPSRCSATSVVRGRAPSVLF